MRHPSGGAITVIVATIVVASLTAPQVAAQGSLTIHRDVITGRVTSDSARGIANVDVIISRAPDRAFLRTVTDSNGHYEIVFEQGTGDYLVHVSAPGMTTVRKRVTRTGVDSAFVVDVVLKPASAAQLSIVNVTASRPKPGRNGDDGPGSATGSMESAVGGVKAAITPDQAGDLAAMAATVPGLIMTRDGASVGGVAPDQNSTTLNGVSFPGAAIPRDVLKGVAVRTSVYDPSAGWFGGAQQTVQLGSEFPLTIRHAHLTLDAPALQSTDQYSRVVGQEFTNLNASLGGGGNVPDHEHLGYDYGVQAGRRVSDGISLSSAPDNVLERVGIAPDSAARLLGTLRTLGLPAIATEPRTTTTALFLGSIGSRAYNFPTYRQVPTTWSLTAYANSTRSRNIAPSPSATGEHSGDAANDIASLQAHVSAYLHEVYLLDATSSLSIAHTHTTPSLDVPSGVLLLESDLSDDANGFSSVGFGGNGDLASDVTKSTWETAANLKLYTPHSTTHRVKIAADSRLDSWRQAVASNPLGTFTFNSIDDLANGHPTSFTRTLDAPVQSASVWNGFMSVGDYWHRSQAFQLLYGVRVEGDRFLSSPEYNPAVESAFGARTDYTPDRFHVSPRIGFAYTMRDGSGSMVNSLGEIPSGPTRYFRGGIGEFRSLLGPEIVGAVRGQTGLASGIRSIACVGVATPIPEWSQYASNPALIPSECNSGYGQSEFTDAAPRVDLLDRNYTAPRSWRANLSYGSTISRVVFSIDGAYSLNLNQPGRVDLNFANLPRFTTSDEGRSVYVGPSAIVAGSGALVPTSSRSDSSFGNVVDHVSTLRSVNRQLTVSLSPDLNNLNGWFASLAYTLSDTRALASGFDNTTFGSPVSREWARGNFDARHSILVQGGVSKKGLTFTLFGRAQSGFPFTPMVGSDVNGDGLSNDRAFIFDPATAADPAVALGMRSLLQSAPGNIRDCLSRQLQSAAGANSCEGPWTASLNAQVDYAFKFPRTRQHANVTIAFMNPLGGLDQALHGASHLHGWGTSAFPDPVLYNVRGFDAVNRRYVYDVNPRFGDTRPQAGIARAPFGITLDFSIDLAPPTDMQVADLMLKPGRNGHSGKRVSAADIRHLYSATNPDPFQAILEQSDSLLLSRSQEDALDKADGVYAAARDSILTALASYLSGVGDRYSTEKVVGRQDELISALWDLSHTSVRRTLPGILNRYQLRMLPWPAADFYAKPDDVTGNDIISH